MGPHPAQQPGRSAADAATRGPLPAPLRVGFTDPQGPRIWRMLPYLFPILLFLFAIFGPIEGVAATLLGIGAVTLFNFIGLFSRRQKTVRSADVHVGPGYVEIKKSGSRNQRIVAKDIIGATTARASNGVLLTLQHKKRDQPITIEVQSDAEAAKIRHALGIGHGGFGTIMWRTLSDNTVRAGFIGRLLATTVGALTIALTLGVSNEAGLFSGIFLGQFALVGLVLGLVELFGRPPEPSVMMGADGLRLKTPRGWFALPYDAIQHLEAHRRGLVFSVPQPFVSVAVERVGPTMGGLSERDVKMLISQITAASQRAKGLGPHKDDVTGRIDVLRRAGESARDWLVRLDMAGQMLSSGPGYRGNTLDVDDLWAILEDPEAEADLRAAAARVLRHLREPTARVRIDAAVAAVRDEATNKRLRIAISDDVDGASQELAYLDATEPVQRNAGMPLPPHHRPMQGR